MLFKIEYLNTNKDLYYRDLNLDSNFLTFHTFEIVQEGKFTLKQSTNYEKCIE